MFQIGQILDDRYQLVEPLKLAGVRQTWRAIDLIHQSPCVVKLLGFHSTLRWQDYERFERETKILKSLQQEFIPRYLASFTLDWEGIHWFALVQQAIPGSSLQTLIEQHHRFTAADIRQIGIDLLQILTDLHGQHPPILHRNIEPGNIILTPDRSVYLVDFGAAGTMADVMADVMTDVMADTMPALPGAIAENDETGSYGYTPLEQFGGQAVPASDLYAVGATLVHLLTGICPADLPQNQQQIQFQSFVDLDDQFTQWLNKMLYPDFNQRFQTAKQALTALLSPQSEVDTIVPVPEIAQRSVTRIASVSDRVKISSFSDQLQVNITRRGLRFVDVLWLGAGALTGSVSVMMLFSQVHPALSILCWLDSLPLFGIGLLSALGEATLTVQSQADTASQQAASISIQWRCLGIPYRQMQRSGAIEAIESAASGITIQTESQPCSIGQFAPPLSQLESEEVVREVKGWMGVGASGGGVSAVSFSRMVDE